MGWRTLIVSDEKYESRQHGCVQSRWSAAEQEIYENTTISQSTMQRVIRQRRSNHIDAKKMRGEGYKRGVNRRRLEEMLVGQKAGSYQSSISCSRDLSQREMAIERPDNCRVAKNYQMPSWRDSDGWGSSKKNTLVGNTSVIPSLTDSCRTGVICRTIPLDG